MSLSQFGVKAIPDSEYIADQLILARITQIKSAKSVIEDIIKRSASVASNCSPGHSIQRLWQYGVWGY